MSLTRSHYVLISKMLANCRPGDGATIAERDLWLRVVEGLTRIMQHDNPLRFDEQRFRLACEETDAK